MGVRVCRADADSLVGAPVSAVYPDLSSREVEVEVDAINSSLGTQLPAAQVLLLL